MSGLLDTATNDEYDSNFHQPMNIYEENPLLASVSSIPDSTDNYSHNATTATGDEVSFIFNLISYLHFIKTLQYILGHLSASHELNHT